MVTCPGRQRIPLVLSILAFAFLTVGMPHARQAAFVWPDNRRAAVSLSFDDGRQSQLDAGVPLLQELGLKVTFYVVPSAVEPRRTAWRAAAAAGHEIGNHSLRHPCSGNFQWARDKALENYTLAQMATELDEANNEIDRLLGVRPTTFAYPCGQTFVGRGTETRSYVPLVAQRFVAGRGWMGEGANDPAFVDLSRTVAVSMDDRELDALRATLDDAIERGQWLVLAGHDIGVPHGPQVTRVSLLRALAAYLHAPERNVWVAPVGEVAAWIRKNQAGSSGGSGAARTP
ncbi:MAG TPA: polysaccharide deacetylase family protein [Vicinamibacterales bacterium]